MTVSRNAAPGTAKTASRMLSPPGEPGDKARHGDNGLDRGGSAEAPASAARLLRCNHCDRGFTRPSHLNRHQLTHLPASRRNIIPCTRCGRSFSRHDVLLRHLRAAHDVEAGAKSTHQKSCFRCVQKKLKCDRELPCHACSVAAPGVACEYPSVESAPDAKPSRESSVTDRDALDGILSRGDLDAAGTPQSNADSTSSSVRRTDASASEAPTLLTAPPSATNGSARPVIPTNGFTTVFPEVEDTTHVGNAFAFPPSLAPAAGQLDFRGSGFDWLNFDVPGVSMPANYGWGAGGLNTDLLSNPLGPSLSSGDTVLPPVESRPSVLPWPFEKGNETTATRCHLPSLRQVLRHTLQQSPRLGDASLEGLAQLFSEHLLPQRGEQLEANTAAGLALLKNLIGHFFSGFQVIQPMIHTGTWNMSECPTMLLAAMACIGAVLSGQANAADLASSISDFCERMINWLGFSDSANYSNIWYLVTLCLHQIYSLGSGNSQLYQNADRTRGVLIGSLRGLDLLSSQLRLHHETEDLPSPTTNNPTALYKQWTSWADDERDRRIAWASFEYDCSLCTLTGRRGAVDLSELPSALPCTDELWEAPTAQSWAALRLAAPPDALGARLSIVLQTVIAGKPVPDHISVWGKRLSSQAIGRLLWDMKQLEIISTREYFGLPSLFKAHQHSKGPLLLGLDCLMASMSQPVTTADLISYNISGLLCHYSHLYAAEDIMDMVLYIVRNIVSRGSRPDNRVILARRRLTEALASDPRRSRQLLWHACQIVAIANQYLVSAPCEIMRLFMGYTFILAFAKYSPRWLHGKGPVVQLDCPSHATGPDPQIADWVQHGGPAKIGATEDIFAPQATFVIARDAQAMFHRLRGWGLSEKFGKIIESFEASEGLL